MQNTLDFNNINLYLLKQVQLTFVDGTCVSGMLSSILIDTNEVLIDDTAYPLSSITDLELTGCVNYHTYHNAESQACDIDGLYFGLEDFVPGTDYSKLLYGEFTCHAACHLVFSEAKIHAKDIRILSLSHKILESALTRAPHIYVRWEDAPLIGKLLTTEAGHAVQTENGEVHAVSFADVQDIIRIPVTNESVVITVKNGTTFYGTVSAANDSMVVLIGNSVQVINLADIITIRYKGTVTTGVLKLPTGTVKQIRITLGSKEDSFLCKLPYFRTEDDEAAAVDGVVATFTPGVTDRGLIAKDVVIESKDLVQDIEEKFDTGIIVIAPTPSRAFGYIGQEFVTKTYSLITHTSTPRGNVIFSADQLSFQINPRYVYIVKYSYNDQVTPLKASKIELIEYLPSAEYAKLWIDAEGNIHKLPVSVLFLGKFLNHPVDIWLNSEKVISGTVLDAGDSEVKLLCEAEQVTIKLEDITRVFYNGIVTAYQSNNGTGFINAQYWFHVNNFSNKDHILRLEVGSSVKYTFEVSTKGNMCAATDIELSESAEKRGYMLKYVPKATGNSFGFIVPPELLEERLKEKKGTIFFRESDLENPSAFNIDTNKFYYSVAYTAGDNNTAYNVKILEAHPIRAKAEPTPAPVQAKTRIETRALSEIVGASYSTADPAYEYGLISLFSTHHALINAQYYNQDYATDGLYDNSKTVWFNPEEAVITPDSRLKTAKCTYLVRYVKKGSVVNQSTGLEQPTIDYTYPVEVICSFSKKQCASIRIVDQTVTIAHIVEAVVPSSPDAPKVSDSSDDAPAFMLGESIYFKLKDGSASHGIYSGENDKAYFLTNGTNIEKSTVTRLFRFGVITALNLENGTATINNSFDFSLSVAELKMVSILKNQKNLIRLHIMYSCAEGKISEVCRISKRCYSCLAWEAGVVTDFDNQARMLTIDSSINHYLTVLSEGVNGYANNGSILNRAVFVKQVFHPFLDDNRQEAEVVAMAVDVRCQEEELRIQYDDGKDVFLGYRNATLSFPVLGSAKVLAEKTGQTVIVSFRVSADMSKLEGYIDEDSDTPSEIVELAEEEHAARIQQEALSLLLLQREDTEQLMAGKNHPGADGKPADQSQVQSTVHFLISKSKHLAAIKIAMQYPEYDVLANTDNLLRSEIQARCTSVGLDANSCYGEQAFYLSTALQYPSIAKTKSRSSGNKYSKYDFLYRLFLQDFESREHLVKYIQNGNPATKTTLSNLFLKPCLRVGELVAHIALLDKLNLNTICSFIRNNKQLSDAIISYAKEEIDDMISGQDVLEVVQAVQDRYLRDKRRFTDRVIALIGTEKVCENLKTMISDSMQRRFLRLICKDDKLRFERLMKICSDVLDYTNKPGFSQQEQLLQHCYREIGLLEEDILTHPCKESVEILMSSGHFDAASNILVSVKENIYALLNRLYQGATNPRIHCRVNETSIHPNSRTFWLIIENGSQSDNLQPAENLQIELELFTSGFTLQKQLCLPQTQIACGDQIAVEVTFELTEDSTSGVLEFGWVAKYEYTTEFQNNGSTTKSTFRQESEHPIQLQIDINFANHKDYSADNPYFNPARGQPLVGKEMFFGREAEMKKILESISTQAEEKSFIPGSAVIIHGQKKSGKTSLVNQIKNYIKDDDVLSGKAIILNFSNILDETGGVELLHCFKRTFYAVIMSRFEDEVCENHPDIAEKMDEMGLEVPDLLSAESESVWSVKFDKFFRDFYRMDGGEHSVILFMDEFTLLCTTILSEIERCPDKAFLNNIPNFIKTFSQYGFIQIIIGHEAMMRALDTLGVLNHTAEFAKSIEISALDDTASRSLITLPMKAKFGYDVYGSELGMQAIERLLDLSGRNPAYLMRLCNKMFMYYTDPEKCPRTQLLLSDVNAMVQAYTGELLLSDFDILLREDGDDTVEAEKRITYHYLKCAALRSLDSYDRRTADSSEITRELSRKYAYTIEEIEKTRNILEARRVISIANGGRVKINTGLFSEYVQQKDGI